MVRLNSTTNGRGTAIVLLVVLYMLVLSPQVSSVSNSVAQDSADAELEERSLDQTSTPANSKVETIEDLFLNYTNDLSRLSAAYDLIGDVDEAKLLDLFEQVTARKYAEEDASWRSELISLISTSVSL